MENIKIIQFNLIKMNQVLKLLIIFKLAYIRFYTNTLEWCAIKQTCHMVLAEQFEKIIIISLKDNLKKVKSMDF